MQPFKIKNRSIETRHPAYIIAEISCNHNGKYEEAVKIIEASAEAGADAVKVQTYTADTITRNFKTKPVGSIWEKMDLYSLYQKGMTPWEWQPKLKAVADSLGIDFISSPFDETAVDFLVNEVKVPALKVASFEAVDTKLLQKMASTGLPIIISNGMMFYEELMEAVLTLKNAGNKNLVILQCNSGYPATFEEANLKTMDVIKEIFDVNVGLSDHSLFVDAENYQYPMPHITPLEAVKMGASVVEVHVIMDREESRLLMEQGEGGFDWSFSRNPKELKKMIDVIREYEAKGLYQYTVEENELAYKTLGEVCFQPTSKEMSSRDIRPSLWIVKDIKKGEQFKFAAEDKKDGNFDSIRPGGGLHVRFTDLVNGKIASRDLKASEMLSWDMIELGVK
ncbi:unnamed protein product [Ectocarpus sp. 12 AP-2014]